MRLSLERQLLDAVEAAKELEERSTQTFRALCDAQDSEQRIYKELHSVKAELETLKKQYEECRFNYYRELQDEISHLKATVKTLSEGLQSNELRYNRLRAKIQEGLNE